MKTPRPPLEADMTVDSSEGAENTAATRDRQTPPIEDTTLAVRQETFLALAAGVGVLEERLKALDVAQPDALAQATDITDRAARALKLTVQCFKDESEPYTLKLDSIKERWAPVKDGFNRVHAGSKTFTALRLQKERDQQEAERRAREEELTRARKVEEEERKAHGDASRETLSALRSARVAVDELPPAGAPLAARTDSGTLFGRQTWAFEVLKLEEVPNEFLTLVINTEAVEEAIARGVRDIQGLRIFPKESTVFRGRKPRGRR